jgi:hypothetical protein
MIPWGRTLGSGLEGQAGYEAGFLFVGWTGSWVGSISRRLDGLGEREGRKRQGAVTLGRLRLQR